MTTPDFPEKWLSPLPLTGGGNLPNRIVPGAMEGLTGGLMLQALTQAQLVDCWIRPFIRVSNAVPGRRCLAAKLQPFLQTRLPLVVQLMGTHTELIAETARTCTELGADAIDLNCACPSKMVVASHAGGALLLQPQWIHDTLRAIRHACPSSGLAVKLRSGFANPQEMPDILAAVAAANPDFVILHFRTVREMYDHTPGRIERFAHARQLLPHINLLGSGDIFRVEDALALWHEARLDGVAVARGLLRNPWLIRDIAAVLNGGPAPARSDRDTLNFIVNLAEAAQRQGLVKLGVILEIARTARLDPAIFQQLSRSKRPAELATRARRLLAEFPSSQDHSYSGDDD